MIINNKNFEQTKKNIKSIKENLNRIKNTFNNLSNKKEETGAIRTSLLDYVNLERFEDFNSNEDKYYEFNLAGIKNEIICSKEVFELLPIKKNKKGNDILDFNDLIPIEKKDNQVRTYWGSPIGDGGTLDISKPFDDAYLITFKTLFECPPYGIIEYLLNKYDDIIYFTKIDMNHYGRELEEKKVLYFKNNDKIIKMIEKDEVLEDDLIEYKKTPNEINWYLPFPAVYGGEYVDAYSLDENSEKYICSCYKKALENKLRMFDDYYQHDYCGNERIWLLLRFLGVPNYYEEKIKNSKKLDKYIYYIELFKFEDNLCPYCNNIKQPEKTIYFPNMGSKFKQTNLHEIEKRCNERGIVSSNIQDEYYSLKSVLSKEDKKLLYPTDDEIYEELKKENLNIELEKEFNKYTKLKGEEKEYLINGLKYNRENEMFKEYDFITKYKLNEEMIYSIQELIKRRYKSIQKEINDDIKEYIKNAMNPIPPVNIVGGIQLWLYRENEDMLLLNFLKDEFYIRLFVKGNSIYEKSYNFSLDKLSTIVKIISSQLLEEEVDNKSFEKFIISNEKEPDEKGKEDQMIVEYSSKAVYVIGEYIRKIIKLDKKSEELLNDWLPKVDED